MINQSELEAFYGPDARIGALGPWFGFALLISLFGLYQYFRAWRLHTDILFICAVALGLALIWPVTYWLRFSPQVWLIPILLALPLLASGLRKNRMLAGAVAAVLTVNICLVGYASAMNQARNNRIFDEKVAFARSVESEEEPLAVFFSNFHMGRVRLSELGIRYRAVSQMCSEIWFALPYSENLICKPTS